MKLHNVKNVKTLVESYIVTSFAIIRFLAGIVVGVPSALFSD